MWLACRPFAFRAAAFQMVPVRSRSPGNAVRTLSSPCHGRAPSARRARDAGSLRTPNKATSVPSDPGRREPPSSAGLRECAAGSAAGLVARVQPQSARGDVAGWSGGLPGHFGCMTMERQRRPTRQGGLGAPAARRHDPVPRHSAVEVRGPGDAFGGWNLNPRSSATPSRSRLTDTAVSIPHRRARAIRLGRTSSVLGSCDTTPRCPCQAPDTGRHRACNGCNGTYQLAEQTGVRPNEG